MLANRFHFHRLTRPDVAKDLIFFRAPLEREDQRDRLADGFGLGVAEHPLGGGIPRHDHAVQVFADDRIVGRLHDGGEPLRSPVRLLERVDPRQLGLLSPCQAGARRLVRLRPFDRKGDLCRNDAGELQLFGRQVVRLPVIQHELAEDAVNPFERNERHGRDVLGAYRRQEGGKAGILLNVGNDNRFGAFGVRQPGRVTFDRPAI